MNRKILLIGILNLLLFIVCIPFLLRANQDDITLYDIPSSYSRGTHRFTGRTGPLQSGIYTVKVYYSSEQDSHSIHCDAGKSDGKPYPLLFAESYTLSALYHEFSYRIWVNSQVDYLDVMLECQATEEDPQPDSSFTLDKIEISRDYRTTVCYKFLKLLALLLVIDGIFCLLWNRKKLLENRYTVLGLTCIFMVSSLSVMSNFHMQGHDSIFHYARIIGLADGMRSGNFPVKIQPGWLHGYGYAASVFYGDLLLYPFALLYALGVPLVHVWKLYILFINTGTVLTSFFCFKKMSRSALIGITCSALYCLSVSRILNIYVRAAVGEFTAFLFLPLIILGIWQIYQADAEDRPQRSWLTLCLGMTGLIQTHILSVEMVCLFLLATVLLLIRKMSVRIFLSLLKSAVTALLLNLGFLLPFLDYSTDTLEVFADKPSYSIQGFGLSLYELFSFGTTASGHAYDSLWGPSGRLPESLGIAMILILLLAFLVLTGCRDWKPFEKQHLLFVMGLAAAALWMTTCYFPWNILAGIPFVKNAAASIQFPWRFMSIAIPLLTYAACLLFVKIKEIAGQNRLNRLMIGLCLCSALQCLYCMDLINRNAEDYSVYYDFRPNLNLSRVASGGEYLLDGTNTNLTWIDLEPSGQNIQAELLSRNGTTMEISCQGSEDAWIELPMFAYRYYRCVDTDTQESFPVKRGFNNKIHIDLPDRYQGTLKLYFREPWHWRLAEIISLITLLLVAVYIRTGRHPALRRKKAFVGK